MSSNIKCSDKVLEMAEEIALETGKDSALETGKDLEIIIVDLLELSSYYKNKRNKKN